jgi:CRP-like cAMP-binding protein
MEAGQTVEEVRAAIRNRETLPRLEAEDDGEYRPVQATTRAVSGQPVRLADTPPKRATTSTAGRFQTLNDFVDQSFRLIDDAARSVWMVLYRETQSNGLATIAHSQIAERMDCSRRTVIRAMGKLEELGLVVVVIRGGIGKQKKSSTYRVHGTPVKVTPVSPSR